MCKKILLSGSHLMEMMERVLAATSRIGNEWMKFREQLPFLTSRAPLLEMKGRVYALAS